MTVAYGDVPLIDPLTGRFPDQFAPAASAQAVLDAQAQVALAAASAGSADSSRVATEAARDAALAVSPAVGTGSPVGVRTPTARGLLYVDTAVTLGALMWVSTGTTSASWRVLSGETGWRDMAASVINSSGGSVVACRVGATLFVSTNVIPTSSGTVSVLPAGVLPAGMLPSREIMFRGSSVGNGWLLTTGEFLIAGATAGTRTTAAGSVPATGSWVTALPGVAG